MRQNQPTKAQHERVRRHAPAKVRRVGLSGLLVLLALGLATATANDQQDEVSASARNWMVIPVPVHSPETGWALTLSGIVSTVIADGPPSSSG
jgi:hypothetical protein